MTNDHIVLVKDDHIRHLMLKLSPGAMRGWTVRSCDDDRLWVTLSANHIRFAHARDAMKTIAMNWEADGWMELVLPQDEVHAPEHKKPETLWWVMCDTIIDAEHRCDFRTEPCAVELHAGIYRDIHEKANYGHMPQVMCSMNGVLQR